jgi:hypothetical protein
MKKDLPENKVEDISVAVVLESETPNNRVWNVYVLNLKNITISTVLVTSNGYGMINNEEVKTSTLRHMIEEVPANNFAKIEAIDESVFGLTNEYWLSYYIGREIFDKKFIFLPESIVDTNIIKIPLIDKPGVMVGQ